MIIREQKCRQKWGMGGLKEEKLFLRGEIKKKN